MNVLPDPLALDVAHDRSADFEGIGNRLLRTTSRKDRHRLSLCELDPVVGLSAARPVFGVSVGHVLDLRAKPKVLETDAVSDITSVADTNPLRDRAVCLHPHKPVSQLDLPLPGYATVPKEGAPGPKATSVMVGRRSEMSEALRERPVTGELEPFSLGLDHCMRPIAAVVRAGVDASNVARPVTNIAKSPRRVAVKNRAAEGLFNGAASP